jgi:hypothetical protein
MILGLKISDHILDHKKGSGIISSGDLENA